MYDATREKRASILYGHRRAVIGKDKIGGHRRRVVAWPLNANLDLDVSKSPVFLSFRKRERPFRKGERR